MSSYVSDVHCLSMKAVIAATTIGVLILGASNSGAANDARVPFIMIPRIDAPVVDGKLEDETWNSAVRITNFIKIDGSALAREQSFCRLGHDGKNLYFGARMSAWALDPASNQHHTFKAAVKEHKGPVWNDDSIELRFSLPDNPKKVFFIAVNANAAIHPLIIDYRNGSGGFKMKPWEPEIEVKAKIDDGFWSFELKVPFKELGSSPDARGFGRLSVSRFEHRLNENSAWADMGGNILNLDNFGWYAFGSDRIGIALDEIPVMRPGENQTSIGIFTAEPRIVSVASTVVQEDGTLARQEKYHRLKGNAVTTINSGFRVVNPAKNWVQFSVADSKGNVLYQTKPLQRADVHSHSVIPEMTFDGTVAGAVELHLNDQKYSMNPQLKVPLTPGINKLLLFIPAGAACDGSFKIGNQVISLESGWKYHLSEQAVGLDNNDDTRKWPDYSPRISRENKGKGICLSKIILVGAGQTFPQFTDNTLYMSVDGTYGFQINMMSCPPSIPEMQVDRLTYFIEVPEGITLAGASGRVGRISRFQESLWKNRNIYSWSDLGTIVRTESGRPEKYRRYRIEREGSASLSSKNPRFGRYDRCTLALNAGTETEKWIGLETKKIIFRVEAENGYIMETDNVLFLKMLPRLAGKAPRKIKFDVGGMVASYRFMACDDLILGIAGTLRAAGVNQMMYDGFQDIPGKTGIATYAFFRYTAHVETDDLIYAGDVLKHFPERYVRQSGVRHPRGICWDALLDSPAAISAFKDAVKSHYKKLPYLSMMFNDYEYPAYAKSPEREYRVNACFCPYSLERFRRKKNIPEPVTVELIGEKYLQQWIDYQCTRVAEQMRLGYEASHESGRLFSSYSGYHSDYTISHYTVDYRKTGRWVDEAAAGYGRPLAAIKATREALQGTPLLGGVLSIPASSAISPAATLLRRILDCGGGVLCWWEDAYDARKLHQVARASTLVADHEDFFLAGALDIETMKSLVASPGIDNIYICKSKNRYLLILLNENQLPVQMPVTFTKALKTLENVSGGKALQVETKLTIPVKGGDYEAFIFEIE